MKKFAYLALFLLLIFGCASRGVNVYIPVSNVQFKNPYIKIVDQRENKNIIGYIYQKGEIAGDITLSNDITAILEKRLAKIKIDKNVDIFIKSLSINYDKSKFTGENINGKLVIKMEISYRDKRVVRVIKIEEKRWISPINSAKEIKEFTKKVIDEGIKHILKVLDESKA